MAIVANDTLTNLDGLSGITSVDGDLVITENDTLTNLYGLGALSSVVDDIRIQCNIILPDCEACDLLDQIASVPAETYVSSNLNDTCTPVPAGCP